MRVLAKAVEINMELTRLITECSSCRLAVAWASVGFEAFDLLAKNSTKIEKMIVGTHFYQTHPDFIETFLTHPNVRFVLKPKGVFHPKVYLFQKVGDEWECLLGSQKFTQAGVSTNDEMAVLMTNWDHGAKEAIGKIKATIDGYWLNADHLSRAELEAYQEAWEQKKPTLDNLQGSDDDNLPHRTIQIGSGNQSANAIFSATILALLQEHGPMTTLQMYPLIKRRLPELWDDSVRRLWKGRDMGPLWQHRVRTAQWNMLRSKQKPIQHDESTEVWSLP
jgi:HKD family nuclease